MSTTVIYKNNALATVNNATKTLKTAGKYMEDDVTLTDVDNTLVVTLSYNDQTEMWEPDCTYAEAYAAYQAGKRIVSKVAGYTASYILYDDDEEWFAYQVDTNFDEPNNTAVYDWGVDHMAYTWTSDNIWMDDSGKYYNLSLATATPSDVAQGKYYYGVDGIHIGTATGSLDVPTFTADETGTSVTCDWTYAECYALVSQGDTRAILDTGEAQSFVTAGFVDSAGDTLHYYYVQNGVPLVQIDYASNGTIEVVQPPDILQTLSVTQNGSYDGFSQGVLWYEVDVNVPTGTARTSADLTVSGATVTVPAGLYASQATKSVASGTAGTPTATKGTVSNHAISVTPSVTNTTGYIEGGTKTGTAVSVSASELVSGTLSITSSGTKDVTNYASASVAAGGATASATKGTVSNHSVTVTPSVTRTAGYVTAGSSNGTAVTVSASELVSGTYTVDSSGTKDVTNYASASVAAGSATASATKGTVSNHSVTVTPSVTRTAGWVSAGSTNGTAVTVSASELVSGTKSITANGTSIDVTNYANVDVAVDNNFAIELTYNSQTGIWEPDCTFNEAKNALINNKNIVSSINYPGTHSSFDAYNELDDQIYYYTEEYNMQNYAYIGRSYIWRSTGEITEDIVETRYDTTTATAIASDVANGKIFFNANGRQVGIASASGGDTYTLTTIVPQQTITTTMSPAGGYQAEVTHTGILEVGKSYLITYDGNTYVSESKLLWGTELMIGTPSALWDTNSSDAFYPCGVDWDGEGIYVGNYDTNEHTVKVDLLEFVDGPLNIIPKSVTANGTYNASSDNADGYSSVTVNVPSGGGTSLPTFSATINSSDQVTSITCDMSYAECAALLAENEPTANVAVTLPDSSTQTWGACGFQNQGFLWYVIFEPSTMEPVAEIEYYSNGTIEATIPPTYIQSLSVTQNGTYSGLYKDVMVNVSSNGGTYQAKTNISPTTSSQTITPDSGYDALSSVQINAMPTGTAGTPTATKGTVSNHSISVTPSVTNTTGYITGSTKTGTAVTVSASELVSGSETKTVNGTYDVTNLASVIVNVTQDTFIVTVSKDQNDAWIPDKTYNEIAAASNSGKLITVKCDVGSGEASADGEFANGRFIYWVREFTGSEEIETGYNYLSNSNVTVERYTYISSDSIITYHTSSSAPTSSQGSDGDLWLVTS